MFSDTQYRPGDSGLFVVRDELKEGAVGIAKVHAVAGPFGPAPRHRAEFDRHLLAPEVDHGL